MITTYCTSLYLRYFLMAKGGAAFNFLCEHMKILIDPMGNMHEGVAALARFGQGPPAIIEALAGNNLGR